MIRRIICNFGRMIRDVNGSGSEHVSPGWGSAPERSDRSGMGAPGARDSVGETRRTAAQDRHALGDERDLLSSANRLSVAVIATRDLSAALNGLQHLPRFPAAGSVGGDLGGAARGPARTAGAGSEPQRRRHRQPVAQVVRKRGCAKGEADAAGYDAGKRVKGREIHALVDTEGLPLRVVVHSAAIQDRDDGTLVFDRIHQRFNWLELVWADGGYNAGQVKRAAAAQPPLRGDRQTSRRQFRIYRPAASLDRRTDLFVVRPKPTFGQGLREPRRHPRCLHHTRLHPDRYQTARAGIDF